MPTAECVPIFKKSVPKHPERRVRGVGASSPTKRLPGTLPKCHSGTAKALRRLILGSVMGNIGSQRHVNITFCWREHQRQTGSGRSDCACTKIVRFLAVQSRGGDRTVESGDCPFGVRRLFDMPRYVQAPVNPLASMHEGLRSSGGSTLT